MKLERVSERVGPTGSLQGEGLANILGRPPFDPLTLALREAAQNIWDARVRAREDTPGEIPRMLVRVRELTDGQSGALREIFSSGDLREAEPADSDLLQKCLANAAPIRVLEICDFGTVGLSGGTDPQSAQGDFVRFFFDVGSTHFESGDGGTYGYGKSSLYLVSAARTIVVDSLLHKAPHDRRFMACRIGNSYQRRSVRGEVARFTGKHFWGVRREGGKVMPLEGGAAAEVAQCLGMPDRNPGDHGTSILIPWPDLDNHEAGKRIAQILLHNLWPKLVSKAGPLAMKIEVEQDGRAVPVESPLTHPHYSLFSSALLTARTRREALGAISIVVGNSRVVTGHIAFETSQREHGRLTEGGSELRPEDVLEAGVHHVALMRSSELVVRYLDFPGIGDGNDWAGVFVCSDDEEVSAAFARSEPPAHDDWIPDRLVGPGATLVRVTKLKRIPEAVYSRFGAMPDTSRVGESGGHSLAAAADNFAAQFLGGDGTAPGTAEGGGSGRPPVRARIKLRPLQLDRLFAEGNRTVARFRTGLSGEGELRVTASVMIDGLGQSDLPAEMELPQVKRWLTPDGKIIEGDQCSISGRGPYYFDIVFMGQYGVIPKCEPSR